MRTVICLLLLSLLCGVCFAESKHPALNVEAYSDVMPGDVNLDGKVDLLDLDLLGQNYGTGVGWAQGDFDGDGDVDLLDLDALGANYGETVPEPVTLLVILFGGIVLLGKKPAEGVRL